MSGYFRVNAPPQDLVPDELCKCGKPMDEKRDIPIMGQKAPEDMMPKLILKPTMEMKSKSINPKDITVIGSVWTKEDVIGWICSTCYGVARGPRWPAKDSDVSHLDLVMAQRWRYKHDMEEFDHAYEARKKTPAPSSSRI